MAVREIKEQFDSSDQLVDLESIEALLPAYAAAEQNILDLVNAADHSAMTKTVARGEFQGKPAFWIKMEDKKRPIIPGHELYTVVNFQKHKAGLFKKPTRNGLASVFMLEIVPQDKEDAHLEDRVESYLYFLAKDKENGRVTPSELSGVTMLLEAAFRNASDRKLNPVYSRLFVTE